MHDAPGQVHVPARLVEMISYHAWEGLGYNIPPVITRRTSLSRATTQGRRYAESGAFVLTDVEFILWRGGVNDGREKLFYEGQRSSMKFK